MKIPYIKIYTADLLAKTRRLSAEQIGNAIIGVCEQAFENSTLYKPNSVLESDFFELLLCWKNESVSQIKQKRNAGKIGGKKSSCLRSLRAQNSQLSDVSTATPSASSTHFKQTDTETDTDIYKEKSKPKKKIAVLTETDTDTETGTVTETEIVTDKKFVKPTIEQIATYCAQRKSSVNPSRFFDFYQSNGWKVGRTAMKDWRAAVRTWEQRQSAPITTLQDARKAGEDAIKDIFGGKV